MKKKGLNLPKEKIFAGPAIIWKRIAAFIFDILIIEFILALPFQSLLKKMIPENLSYSEAYAFFTGNMQYTTILTVIMIMISLLALFYFAILEYKFGQSIGKMILNIRVISETKNLTLLQCIGRNLFLIPVFPFIILWFVDPIFLFLNKNSQRFSDTLTKTKVVQDYIIR